MDICELNNMELFVQMCVIDPKQGYMGKCHPIHRPFPSKHNLGTYNIPFDKTFIKYQLIFNFRHFITII